MNFILIVIMSIHHGNVVSFAEFNSKTTCEQAGKALITLKETASYSCTPK